MKFAILSFLILSTVANAQENIPRDVLKEYPATSKSLVETIALNGPMKSSINLLVREKQKGKELYIFVGASERNAQVSCLRRGYDRAKSYETIGLGNHASGVAVDDLRIISHATITGAQEYFKTNEEDLVSGAARILKSVICEKDL